MNRVRQVTLAVWFMTVGGSFRNSTEKGFQAVCVLNEFHLLGQISGHLASPDEFWVYKNKVNVPIAVSELKLGSARVVVFVQCDWLSHDIVDCLRVFLMQIVQEASRHFNKYN